MAQLTEAEIYNLTQLCPHSVHRNVNLSTLSNWRIGGLADIVIRPSSPEQTALLRSWFAEREIDVLLIGLTTNLLFADEGVRTPIIQIGPQMGDIKFKDNLVEAEAGAWVPCLARKLMKAGLSGGEHTCGIPGTLGGLIAMNGGSQRKGIGSNIIEVESIDENGNLHKRSSKECYFSYRTSIYQTNREIITRALLTFSSSTPAQIRRSMLTILRQRRAKFPRKQPNCGSVFKSDPAMYKEFGPPGTIIEKLGFKGLNIGGATVSPMHANFIVNSGDASAADVLKLIHTIQHQVKETVGYDLESEVHYVLPSGSIISANEAPLIDQVRW